jgi:sensor histidine kinase YesM
LQPFIENAIKHGILKIALKGKIIVIFEVKDHFRMCFAIEWQKVLPI